MNILLDAMRIAFALYMDVDGSPLRQDVAFFGDLDVALFGNPP